MGFQVKYIYDLVDQISPKLKKINQSLNKSTSQIRKSGAAFKKNTDNMKRGFNGVDKSAIGLTSSIKRLAIGFIGIQTVRNVVTSISDFGTAMAKVKAVTKATAFEMQEMSKLARKLGETTEFTAGQAASGMSFLGMAGFEATEILKAMPAVLNLATAGQLGLAEAADISSNIMSGFNIKAGEMTRVADSMAIVAASANTNIFQLGDAMKFVGPVAASAGISLEKSAAAIGVLSDAGLQGTLAGTGLRRIISELANPTKEAQKIFVKMGLTFADINPQTNELTDILKKLKPLASDTGAAFKVFGDRGAPAFQVLANGIPKVKQLNKEMLNTKGAAKEMADTMRDNLGGDIKGLFSAMEGLILRIGESGLTKSLRSSTQGVTTFFRALSGNQEALDSLGSFAELLANILRMLGKILAFSFGGLKTGLDVIVNTLNKAVNIGSGLIGGGVDIAKNIIGGDQNINQNSNFNGKLDVNVNNLPSGSNTEFKSIGKSPLNVGVNSTFAGAR